MSPQEWNTVEAEMALPWGVAKLQCDGYELTLQVGKVAPMRYCIGVYVNGVFKGEWCSHNKPCDEQRRFLRPIVCKAYRTKDLAMMKKVYSAKQFKELAAKTFNIYSQAWSSFAKLKRHLVKHNTAIELLAPMPAAGPGVNVLANIQAAVADARRAA